VAVATGWVGVLALTSIALAAWGSGLDPPAYLLMRDLGRVAFLLWGILTLRSVLAAAAPTVERAALPLGHLLRGAPWSRAAHRFWMALVAAAAAAILLPHILPSTASGLSLRVSLTGPVSADAPHTRIAEPALDNRVGRGAARPLGAAIAGWVFMPWTGEYQFELTARGDARLEIDGAVVLHVGDLETPGPADEPPDGTAVRRAPANLLKGFHRITIVSRQPVGDAHLVLRWTPPDLTGSRAIPAYYLLPDDAAPETRRWRALILVGHRAGFLAMTLLVVLRLAGLTQRGIDALSRGGHPRMPRGGRPTPPPA
jgi:hypothetical protein